MTLDDLLQSLRVELTARATARGKHLAAIRGAVDAYIQAHERQLASEFAARNGLPAPVGSSDVVAAALELRALATALPEFVSSSSTLSSPDPPQAAHEAVPGVPSVRGELSPVRQQTMEILTLEEAQRILAAEFDATPFASMRLDEFMLYAEEFAAAARALQERTGGDPLSQRVIRKLTALVHERELPRRVFGLSRAHTADWQRLANEARARRLSAEATRDHSA